jgi:predicted nuclease with TOPRIM domain
MSDKEPINDDGLRHLSELPDRKDWLVRDLARELRTLRAKVERQEKDLTKERRFVRDLGAALDEVDRHLHPSPEEHARVDCLRRLHRDSRENHTLRAKVEELEKKLRISEAARITAVLKLRDRERTDD